MDFEIDGRQFRAEKLPALKQFRLSRKIAPLLLELAPLFVKASALKPSSSLVDFAQLAEPFAEALSTMPDADADQVLIVTLTSVRVQTSVTPEAWVPLWVEGANAASVIELNDIGKLLPIVLRVIRFNLEDFIFGFLTSRGEPSTPAALSGVTSPARKTG